MVSKSLYSGKEKNISLKESFADHYHYWSASPTSPGINYIDVEHHGVADIEHISKLVRSVKENENADFVVLSIHWGMYPLLWLNKGSNYCWEPPTQFIKFAHKVIETCDIDIIHGHSSHHIQVVYIYSGVNFKGIEIHNGKPILYGCGDFVDDYAVEEEYRNNLGTKFTIN